MVEKPPRTPMVAWHPPSETARRPGKRRKIKRSGETPRRRQRLWPSAPGFGYNEALPEQYDPAKFPKTPPATDALSPMGQKSSFMQTFAQARTLPLRPHQYSAMPLPALPINELRGKHASRAPCLAASSLQCPTCSHSSRHEWAILRVRFIAFSALFPFLHPIFRHKKSAGASNAAAPNMRIAACLAA